MKNLPYPQLVAGGELTPDEWQSLQDEILAYINRADNAIAGIMLYT